MASRSGPEDGVRECDGARWQMQPPRLGDNEDQPSPEPTMPK
jgi:hypothetical protein